MNVFTVIGIVGVSMVIFTGLIAFVMVNLSKAVVYNEADMERDKMKYKPAQTGGFQIAVDEAPVNQFKEARVEAAKRAAALPRGGNMGIGRLGQEKLRTASRNLTSDPISAFKIAQQQGWRGLGEFEALQSASANQPAAVAVAAGPAVKKKLVPGVDYPATEITDSMSPSEKRQARIANSKAKMAAMKALKAAGADMVAAAPVAAPAAAAAVPAAAPEPSAADLGIPEPVLIEITDDMDPADKRKARISNSKAMSAYKKALKAAGVSTSAPAAAPAPAAAAAAPAPAPAAPAPAAAPVPVDAPPPPELIEITDDMDPADKRKARISNSKAMSAYKKSLKAAGIDPKSLNL